MLTNLQVANAENIRSLSSWFRSNEDVLFWGGPGLEFPIQATKLQAHLQANDFKSFALMQQGNMLGFGQFQLFTPYLHLGRIIVNPAYRGKGYAHDLVRALVERGKNEALVKRVSLFVYSDNKKAHQLYLKMGFKKSSKPSGFRDVAGSEFLTIASSSFKY